MRRRTIADFLPERVTVSGLSSQNHGCSVLRARAEITSHFGIPSPGHLWPILNRKILEIVLLLLRFRSIGSTKPHPDLGANSANLFLRGPLGGALALSPVVSYYCGRREQRPLSYRHGQQQVPAQSKRSLCRFASYFHGRWCEPTRQSPNMEPGSRSTLPFL
jgi:hypothetical protein